MAKKDNLSTLLLLGALGIGGYFLYKTLTNQSNTGYSMGWIPGDTTPQTPMNNDSNLPVDNTPKTDNSVIPAVLPPQTVPVTLTPTVINYPISPNQTQPIITAAPTPTITATYTTPASYVTTTNQPTTTIVQRTGTFTNTFQNVATTPISRTSTSNRVGLVTVGTPTQQITQFSTAPRLVTVGGVVRKVM